MKKICKICKKEKNISEFYFNKEYKDNYRNKCKKCNSIYNKKYYIKNIKKLKKYKQKWYLLNKLKLDEKNTRRA